MNKVLKNLIHNNSTALQNSAKDFESLYNIIFSNEGVLGETNDGFRIQKHHFAEVKKRIESVSSAIYELIGSCGEYIALDMDNSIEWIVSFWSILRSGNKPYLVNTRHPISLSDKILNTLGIKFIISQKNSLLKGTTLLYENLIGKEAFEGAFENEMALSTSATSLRETICFYSGSEISSQILNVLGFIKKYPEIATTYKGSIKQLAFLPFYHVFGFIAVYLWFSFFGQTIVFLPDLASDTILKTCRKHKVTHIFAVPLLWHTIEKEIQKNTSDEKKAKKLAGGICLCTALQNILPHWGILLSQRIMSEVTNQLMGDSVRFCITGGSYIRESALKLINGIGYPLHNGYGMSEVGITSVELRNRPRYRNLNSIGAPFDSVSYRINERGVLEIKGSSICQRIMIDGDERPVNDWFETGDIMEERNGFYYILGREGDMVLGENGENINPDIIEKGIYLPWARNFSVLGIEKDGFERLSIVIEISKYISTTKIEETVKSVYDYASQLDGAYAIKDFYFTYDPIMSDTAVKVSRKYLKRSIASENIKLVPFNEIKLQNKEKAEINPALKKEVMEILAGVLDKSPEEIDEDAHILFDLGATSIEYFSLLSLLANHFSVTQYTDKDSYCYTVNDICKYLERFIA